MRQLATLLVMALLVGCGGEPEAPSKTTKTKKKTTQATPVVAKKSSEPPPTPKVDQNAFSSVSQALDAYVAAAAKDDQPTMQVANNWMITQGAPAVAPLSQVLADETASSQHRIVACKILSQLPGSKTPLMGAVDTGKKEVRVNVVQALGRVKPADKEVIAKLIELVQADDVDIQRYAVASLGKQGKAAKDAVPLVQSILNDKKYNDTVRAEARKTLKEIDPRKGLMGISGEEGK